MDTTIPWFAILKVLIAILLGGLIGVEREIASKPAGLRTHMLVAGASALFVILGDMMIQTFYNSIASTEVLRSDPIRIMEAIITGISFLGAGTIFFRNKKNTVEGLTTAASILFVAGIGIAVAIGQIGMAFMLTILVIIILQLVYLIEKWIDTFRSKGD